MALALHWSSVEEGLKNISSRELTEWMSYYELDPFGFERGDLNAAIVSNIIVKTNSTKNVNSKIEDFMPKFYEEEEEVQDNVSLLEKLNKIFSGKDKRKGEKINGNIKQFNG